MSSNFDNPVSRKIVELVVCNRLGDYLPLIGARHGDVGSGYWITARLPQEAHKKWLPFINENKDFRENVIRKIEALFEKHVFNHQSFLEVRFGVKSTSFETDGINGCMIYVDEEGGEYGYTSHNIDTLEQALILFLALSIYLHLTLEALELLEAKKENFKRVAKLKEPIIYKINLNKVKDCSMEAEDCIHWKSWICEYCTRNPKSFSLKSQEDLPRLGDKWEPEGGLPGKVLCISCGANLSKPICHYCNTDNSQYFSDL